GAGGAQHVGSGEARANHPVPPEDRPDLVQGDGEATVQEQRAPIARPVLDASERAEDDDGEVHAAGRCCLLEGHPRAPQRRQARVPAGEGAARADRDGPRRLGSTPGGTGGRGRARAGRGRGRRRSGGGARRARARRKLSGGRGPAVSRGVPVGAGGPRLVGALGRQAPRREQSDAQRGDREISNPRDPGTNDAGPESTSAESTSAETPSTPIPPLTGTRRASARTASTRIPFTHVPRSRPPNGKIPNGRISNGRDGRDPTSDPTGAAPTAPPEESGGHGGNLRRRADAGKENVRFSKARARGRG